MTAHLQIQECPACGWHDAIVHYALPVDGKGGVTAQAIISIECPNPYCEHGKPSPH